MTRFALVLGGVFSLLACTRMSAQKPSEAPANALGQCKDGTYVSTGSRSSACASHKGLKVWYLDGTPNTQPGDSDAPKPAGRTATGRKVGGVPSDALGLCQDGTYVSTGSKQTACSAHGGMKVWYLDGTPNTQPGDSDVPKPAGHTATGRKVGGVPSDALGLCQDGTYVSTGSKQTACSAHGGMKTWYPDGTPNT